MSNREKIRELPFEDLQARPEIITDLLSTTDTDEVAVLLRRSGNTVRFAATKTYTKEATRLLADARAEYLEKKRQGYSREDAIADFERFQVGLANRTE